MSELRATLKPGNSIQLQAEGPRDGISVQRLDDGSWSIWLEMGQRVELRRSGGPVRAAALRARCSTDRGWVIERQVRDWELWVEWCVIPRLMPIDWDPEDEYAFVDEEYADYEQDYEQDVAPHHQGARMWQDAWALRAHADAWKQDMKRIREPDDDAIDYIVGDLDEMMRLLDLDDDPAKDNDAPECP